MQPDRKTTIARKEAERVILTFFQVTGRDIAIKAKSPVDIFTQRIIIAHHDARAGMAVFFKTFIWQEMLTEIHILMARKRR
ncbi:MAG: Uncharacterised protein [Hyphomonas sp. TMED17]|nr:MAG: Uncharacterised protein [Hyphomonas sp. TMED17]